MRFASEYASEHIPGAVNASYTRLPDYAESRVPRGADAPRPLRLWRPLGGRQRVPGPRGLHVKYVNGDFADYAAAHEVEAETADLAA